MTVGKKIQEARKKAGYTQRELADMCKLATGTIQQYELDKREPNFERLFLIAEKLQVSVTDLIDEDTFNRAAEQVAIESLENLTIKMAKTLFSLAGYKLKETSDKNFLLFTDIKYAKVKSINLDLGDLSEVEVWTYDYLEKVINHLFNQKNNPNYSPMYRDLPYYLDDEILAERKEDAAKIKHEFEELQQKPKPQIHSYYEMQHCADMEKEKTNQDTND